MTDIETMNPFAATSHDHVVERRVLASIKVDAWYVDGSSRQRWFLTTSLGTAVGGGLFFPPDFFIGGSYAATVALPIAAAMSYLIRSDPAGTGSRTQRVLYSNLSGAVTVLLCVFFINSSSSVVMNGEDAWAVALGSTSAGISSLLFGSRFRLKKLAAPKYQPVEYPEAVKAR